MEVTNLIIDTSQQSLIWEGFISWLVRMTGRSAASLRAQLGDMICGGAGLAAWLLAGDCWGDAAPIAPAQAQRALDEAARRAYGVYFTPDEVARGLVALVPELEVGGALVDLSAGAGALLVAALERWPERRVVAVERDETLALACACALIAARGKQRCEQDCVIVGDGLGREVEAWVAPGEAALVLANPPYLGEKGRAAQFRALREAHPHLAGFFGARQDLLYLFLHRGLDLLAPGGVQASLTSAYWVQATGAARLRRDMMGRGHVSRMVRVGARLFEDAPGHHSLLCVTQRREASEAAPTCLITCDVLPQDGWSAALEAGQRLTLDATGAPWVLEASEVDTTGWTALGELVRDCQGFVSGLDRVTARHVRELERLGLEAPPEGAPGFLFMRGEVPPALARDASGWLMPLLRAHMVEAGGVHRVASGEELVLYVDGPIEDAEARAAIEAQLGPLRPLLERRREVEQGRMSWTRLHWPRRRADQLGPKLVVPRRAARACFMLDLSGSMVSSDCTYLVAPPWAADAVEHLGQVMEALQSEAVGQVLAAQGKRKGALLEFYAEPLRALKVPLVRRGDGLARV
jgi:adenine-specific DNA-methyltransferase